MTNELTQKEVDMRVEKILNRHNHSCVVCGEQDELYVELKSEDANPELMKDNWTVVCGEHENGNKKISEPSQQNIIVNSIEYIDNLSKHHNPISEIIESISTRPIIVIVLLFAILYIQSSVSIILTMTLSILTSIIVFLTYEFEFHRDENSYLIREYKSRHFYLVVLGSVLSLSVLLVQDLQNSLKFILVPVYFVVFRSFSKQVIQDKSKLYNYRTEKLTHKFYDIEEYDADAVKRITEKFNVPSQVEYPSTTWKALGWSSFTLLLLPTSLYFNIVPSIILILYLIYRTSKLPKLPNF